jgi:hypothetical protein
MKRFFQTALGIPYHINPTCPSSAIGCTNDTSTGLPYDDCCVSRNGLMVLAQNWSIGLTYGLQPWTRANVVDSLSPTEFQMHGLWPDNCDGSFNRSTPDYNIDLWGCDVSRA